MIRAANLSAFSLPIDRFPTAEHLYSATGWAPARYQSATITRTGKRKETAVAVGGCAAFFAAAVVACNGCLPTPNPASD